MSPGFIQNGVHWTEILPFSIAPFDPVFCSIWWIFHPNMCDVYGQIGIFQRLYLNEYDMYGGKSFFYLFLLLNGSDGSKKLYKRSPLDRDIAIIIHLI